MPGSLRSREGSVERRRSSDPYSGRMLEVDVWPELRDPVIVLALSGWVDAGWPGRTRRHSCESNSVPHVFALDLSDLVDLQQTRPMVEIVDGTTRRITWPVIECVAGRAAATRALHGA